MNEKIFVNARELDDGWAYQLDGLNETLTLRNVTFEAKSCNGFFKDVFIEGYKRIERLPSRFTLPCICVNDHEPVPIIWYLLALRGMTFTSIILFGDEYFIDHEVSFFEEEDDYFLWYPSVNEHFPSTLVRLPFVNSFNLLLGCQRDTRNPDLIEPTTLAHMVYSTDLFKNKSHEPNCEGYELLLGDLIVFHKVFREQLLIRQEDATQCKHGVMVYSGLATCFLLLAKKFLKED